MPALQTQLVTAQIGGSVGPASTHARQLELQLLELSIALPHGDVYLGRANANPDATNEEMRAWLLRLMREGCSYSYVNQTVSALKFLHSKVLRRGVVKLELPRPRQDRSLPNVLSRDEVRRLIEAVTNLKHRAMLLVLYSGGLRVGEVIRLQVTDIESDRGMIRVRKGKGRKDRYVMLSRVTLEALRDYARVERPVKWLFTGARRDRHYNARSLDAESLADLRIPPSNHLEALKGNRKGQHSLLINQQYRICFRWTEAGVHDAEIVDYHT